MTRRAHDINTDSSKLIRDLSGDLESKASFLTLKIIDGFGSFSKKQKSELKAKNFFGFHIPVKFILRGSG